MRHLLPLLVDLWKYIVVLQVIRRLVYRICALSHLADHMHKLPRLSSAASRASENNN